MTTLGDLPTLSAQQTQQLSNLMQGVSAVQQIKLAGARVAAMAAFLLAEDDASLQSVSLVDSLSDLVADRPIVVLTGPGDTGAAGLTAARHLDEADAWVQVLTLLPPHEHTGYAAAALSALVAADIPLIWADDGWELPPCDLLIDALNGADQTQCQSLSANTSEDTRENILAARPLFELTNSSLAPILSIGAPSSVRTSSVKTSAVETSNANRLFVQASATLALGLPHSQLHDPTVRAAAGNLYLADMDIPPSLIQSMGLTPTVNFVDLFSNQAIIQI